MPAETRDDETAREAESSSVSPETLMRMASHYLARYSASTARLRQVLERKIRRRCEQRTLPLPAESEIAALIDAVVERLTRAELIDDAAYGRGRAAALVRKGWPAWRIKAELERQGVAVDAAGIAEAVDLDEIAQAMRLAERKRLGPFRPGDREAHRDKDIARLARAGFPVWVARAVVDAESVSGDALLADGHAPRNPSVSALSSIRKDRR